eukprot:g7384.t1
MGGVLDPTTGRIYGIPGSAKHVLLIDPPYSCSYCSCSPEDAGGDGGRGRGAEDGGSRKAEGPRLSGFPCRGVGKGKKHRRVVDGPGPRRPSVEREQERPVLVSSAIPGNKFKWLRGVFVPTDRAVYGIPCNARQAWQWHGGCYMRDLDSVLAVPCNARRVLQITPRRGEKTEEARLIGPDIDGAVGCSAQKFYGGVVSVKNGAFYCIPYNAKKVLRVSKTGAFDFLSSRLVEQEDVDPMLAGKYKWHGAVASVGGEHIVGIPSHADTVLLISVGGGGERETAEGPRQDRENGCGPQGDEMDITSTRKVLVEDELDFIPIQYGSCPSGGGSTSEESKRYQYGGGVLGPDGCVYCIPSDASRVLKIDPVKRTAVLIGGTAYPWSTEGLLYPGMKNKWQNGFFSEKDNCIYCIPCDAPTGFKGPLAGGGGSSASGSFKGPPGTPGAAPASSSLPPIGNLNFPPPVSSTSSSTPDLVGRVNALMESKMKGAGGAASASGGGINFNFDAPAPPARSSIDPHSRLDFGKTISGVSGEGPRSQGEKPRQGERDVWAYFTRIVEQAFSEEFRKFWTQFESKSGGRDVLKYGCQEVIHLSFDVRRNALGELLLIREEFEAMIAQAAPGTPALNMITALMSGVFAFTSALFHLRAECVPRVFKDQMLLLLYNWDSIHHSGILQQYFWSFHYHSHSFLLDHPAKPAEADLAYCGSMLSQIQVMLERDLQVSFEAVNYFVASGEILMRNNEERQLAMY